MKRILLGLVVCGVLAAVAVSRQNGLRHRPWLTNWSGNGESLTDIEVVMLNSRKEVRHCSCGMMASPTDSVNEEDELR